MTTTIVHNTTIRPFGVLEAAELAKHAHKEQKYGDEPYITHVLKVADLVASFGEEAVIVGLLHDVVEDTDVTIDTIREKFGDKIAIMVGYITDEPGANRRERKRVTNKKLAAVAAEYNTALVVKAADRLVNLRSGQKLDMYRREHPEFKKAVYRPGLCDHLWEEMDCIVGA